MKERMTSFMPIIDAVDDESFRIALARFVTGCRLRGADVLVSGNGIHRAKPHVPALSAPELLRLSSERIASSSTAPTTGLRR